LKIKQQKDAKQFTLAPEIFLILPYIVIGEEKRGISLGIKLEKIGKIFFLREVSLDTYFGTKSLLNQASWTIEEDSNFEAVVNHCIFL
jgi:hypothetical protein